MLNPVSEQSRHPVVFSHSAVQYKNIKSFERERSRIIFRHWDPSVVTLSLGRPTEKRVKSLYSHSVCF